MAWQTPKTDWSAADGVRDVDFNRIEENILELYNTESAKSDITIYVKLTGSDTAGNGTYVSPYRTVNKAISVLPKNLGSITATIDITTGNYDEIVTIAGFNGTINLLTVDGPVRFANLIIDGCTVTHSGSQLNILPAATATGIILQHGAVFKGSSTVYVGGGRTGINVRYGSSFVVLGTVTVSNTTAFGIDADTCGSVYISTIGGTGNVTGISATVGGVVTYGSTSINATTRHLSNTGGRIYSGAQTSVPNY